MPVIAIIGAQWGDEGKGKVVDLLAEKAGMVVRFSGASKKLAIRTKKPAAKRCSVAISTAAPIVNKKPNQVMASGVMCVLAKNRATGLVRR